MTDLQCFIEFVEGKLSDEGQKLWRKAVDRHAKYGELFDSVLKSLKRDIGAMSPAELEAKSIKAIVDFELKRHKKEKDWTFKNDGIGRLADDFFLLNEYISNYAGDRRRKWAKDFGKLILPDSDLAEVSALPDEKAQTDKLVEKVMPLLDPVVTFFGALCHTLQEGENELTAIDAYWLGLVDEVIGEGLWTTRYIEEYKPDPPTVDAKPNEEAKATGEGQTSAAGA